MREIKFRAWTTDSIMHSGRNILKINGEEISKSTVLMQYTGLKYEKGVKIYEGDLVKNALSDILEIIWNEDRCHFEMAGRYDKSYIRRELDRDIVIDLVVKVIGNIYENIELLKENK
jgi:uncharacterized phage protein (TIGR01671 family)